MYKAYYSWREKKNKKKKRITTTTTTWRIHYSLSNGRNQRRHGSRVVVTKGLQADTASVVASILYSSLHKRCRR